MPHKCPAGKVHNHMTGRCVSITGRIGRNILKEVNSRKQRLRDDLHMLPTDMVSEIWGFAPFNPSKNCGTFISYLHTKHQNLDALTDPKVIARLRYLVSKTLRAFQERILSTHYIKRAAVTKPAADLDRKPLYQRIQDAIAGANAFANANELVQLCKLIVCWKREVINIVDRLRIALQHIETYARTGVRPDRHMQGLFIQHGYADLIRIDKARDPAFLRTIRRQVAKDVRALPNIVKPIVLR